MLFSDFFLLKEWNQILLILLAQEQILAYTLSVILIPGVIYLDLLKKSESLTRSTDHPEFKYKHFTFWSLYRLFWYLHWSSGKTKALVILLVTSFVQHHVNIVIRKRPDETCRVGWHKNEDDKIICKLQDQDLEDKIKIWIHPQYF